MGAFGSTGSQVVVIVATSYEQVCVPPETHAEYAAQSASDMQLFGASRQVPVVSGVGAPASHVCPTSQAGDEEPVMVH